MTGELSERLMRAWAGLGLEVRAPCSKRIVAIRSSVQSQNLSLDIRLQTDLYHTLPR